MLTKMAEQTYQARIDQFGDETMRLLERLTYLRVLDNLWIEHLEAMDSLRNGIGLRAIGQRDPLVEYKQEAYKMYQNLVGVMEAEIATAIFHVQVIVEQPEAPVETALTRAAEQANTNAPLDTAVPKISRTERRQTERGTGNMKSTKKKKKKRR
jgi:preprotein translocase subunit SecA